MATKVLLLEDVDHEKRKGEVISVRPGFARNFLLPKGYAVVATQQTLKKQAKLQEERRQKAEGDHQEATKISAQLEGVVLTTEVKVDHEGHMYGSVSAHDIIELIKAHTGVELEKRTVQLKHPIKATGAYDIQLRLMEGVPAAVHLKVVPEGAVKAE